MKVRNDNCVKHGILWIVFVLFGLMVFPYILNRVVLIGRFWDVVGGPKEWLSFWPSYLSAFVSAVMIIYTAMTLKNNERQLDELKRQWEDEHKPSLTISYNMISGVAYLRIINTSKAEIRNLKINGDFYIGEERNKYFDMSILSRFDINIEPQGVRNIILHPNIEPLSNDCYFILKYSCNQIAEREEKIYCNEIYSIGDDIIWRKMIDAINKMRNR